MRGPAAKPAGDEMKASDLRGGVDSFNAGFTARRESSTGAQHLGRAEVASRY